MGESDGLWSLVCPLVRLVLWTRLYEYDELWTDTARCLPSSGKPGLFLG